ncbi:DUF3124 domain-containing protein [Trichocoleus sp. FACHB-90]|uniref:DUF3124 domain-containing protein n=1 Tax=Cyanophyceae TaxID=3028117 RepID=UPI001688176B|nr:DUF3124 domain-containing protein [Trichocoleus sp. FACHB-90]
MKLYLLSYAAVAVIVLTSCTSQEKPSQSVADIDRVNPSVKVVTLDKNFKIVMGQTIYVPAYSYIYHYDRQETYNLTATLSIRNTDLTNQIVITSVRYNNSAGNLVRKYLERPTQLAALASTSFVVDSSDNSGGLGANFIVEWVAQTEVTQPIIEAIMIGSSLQQGISWISPGKVIKSQNNRSPETSLSGF